MYEYIWGKNGFRSYLKSSTLTYEFDIVVNFNYSLDHIQIRQVQGVPELRK